MARIAEAGTDRQVARAVLLGLVTLALYVTLFLFEEHVLELSTRGEWHFLIPVGIAFAFSLVHGAFTGSFWDALGVRAKK
jgi:hypothetical protein